MNRALKITTESAKKIVEAFYGTAPAYSYFSGCSTGGRQALMAAQRFPGHWNGILVGAPINHMTAQYMGFAWNQQALRTDPDSYIPPTKGRAMSGGGKR
jgi:feruloyl esterase